MQIAIYVEKISNGFLVRPQGDRNTLRIGDESGAAIHYPNEEGLAADMGRVVIEALDKQRVLSEVGRRMASNRARGQVQGQEYAGDTALPIGFRGEVEAEREPSPEGEDGASDLAPVDRQL